MFFAQPGACASVTATLVSGTGPVLVTTMWYVTVDPAATVRVSGEVDVA